MCPSSIIYIACLVAHVYTLCMMYLILYCKKGKKTLRKAILFSCGITLKGHGGELFEVGKLRHGNWTLV